MSFEQGWLVRVQLRAEAGSDEVVNTLHYQTEASIPQLDVEPSLQALADRLRDDLQARYAALFNPGWTIHPIVVTEELDPLDPSAPRQQRSSGASLTGTRNPGTEFLPQAATLVVTELTNLVGRSFRGRLFMGGSTAEGDQQNGSWQTGIGSYWLAVQDFVDNIPLEPDIVVGPSAYRVHYIVFSRTRRARSQSPYFASVTDHIQRPAVRWLRSRQD